MRPLGYPQRQTTYQAKCDCGRVIEVVVKGEHRLLGGQCICGESIPAIRYAEIMTRRRFAWWPVPVRTMEGKFLRPEPVRKAWLEPVVETRTRYNGWVAYDRHQPMRSQGVVGAALNEFWPW